MVLAQWCRSIWPSTMGHAYLGYGNNLGITSGLHSLWTDLVGGEWLPFFYIVPWILGFDYHPLIDEVIFWLVVWNMFYFPINIGFLIIPHDELRFFRTGWRLMAHQPEMFLTDDATRFDDRAVHVGRVESLSAQSFGQWTGAGRRDDDLNISQCLALKKTCGNLWWFHVTWCNM